MVILKRRCGEEIIIGDTSDIRIKVLSTKKGLVSLGIAAPLSLPVNRREIYEHLQDTKTEDKNTTLKSR